MNEQCAINAGAGGAVAVEPTTQPTAANRSSTSRNSTSRSSTSRSSRQGAAGGAPLGVGEHLENGAKVVLYGVDLDLE